ncbi:MAG: hypothetical protein E7138_05690 [Rikenellaceae bacterium]|nr:hypothetical protein [Rikenellaceae bacterium]
MSKTQFTFTCSACGFKFSMYSIHNTIPSACPHCKCIDWIAEDANIQREKEIKWEQRRYELAKEFLLRVCFPPEVFESCLGMPQRADTVAQVAVMMADALIKHLRQDETEQSD